jgi:hypothetical protein
MVGEGSQNEGGEYIPRRFTLLQLITARMQSGPTISKALTKPSHLNGLLDRLVRRPPPAIGAVP